MKKYLSLIMVLALLLTVVLSGCTGKTPNNTSPSPSTSPAASSSSVPSSEPKEDFGQLAKFISIGANPIGQTAYTWAAGMSDVINKKALGISASAEETKGYPENARLMIEGEIELGFVNNMMLLEAYNAIGGYANLTPKKVLGVMRISPTEMHVVKLKSSDIKTVKDFKGKRIGLGQPGGISMVVADKLMDAIGYAQGDFKDIRVNLAEQVEMLKNKQLDVAIWIGSAPLPAINELATTEDIEFLPIPDDVIENLQKIDSIFVKDTIKASTYRGQDEAVPTFSLQNVLAANADVSNETVYQFTKAIIEGLADLGKVHPAFLGVTKETLLEGITTPIHPGALRYYKEAGVPGIEKFEK